MALGKCKERKWSTSSFSATIMPRNLAEGERWKGAGKKKVQQGSTDDTGGKEEKEADIQGHTV